jgi:cytochrome c
MQTRSALLAALLASFCAAPAFAQGDAEAGEKVFNKCKTCHQVGPEAKNRVGPELNGIVGREIASAPDFKYSDAFLAKKEEGFTWTEETLAEYLADPKGYIPGNKMTFVGLKKPEDIANVLAYITQESGEGEGAHYRKPEDITNVLAYLAQESLKDAD